jgi:predicted ATPase
LLLLHQALFDREEIPRTSRLSLDGPLVSLGSMRDVVNRGASARAFRVGLSADALRVDWFLEEDREDVRHAAIVKTRRRGPDGAKATRRRLFPQALDGAPLVSALRQLRYAPADRLGPANSYPLLPATRHRALGPRGERAVGALYLSDPEDPVLDGLRHPRLAEQPRLDRQVEAWLGNLFSEVVIDIQPIGPPTTPNSVTLSLRTSPAGEFDRPANVGFGMTYVLPVLVALIGAKAGDIVVLENPEAHLHPRAQSEIARLCAKAARAGVQVLIETHSDHVLNATRVAVRLGVLPRENVAIHFFGPMTADGQPRWVSIGLGPGERYTTRPALFFDEIERQLGELFEPKA